MTMTSYFSTKFRTHTTITIFTRELLRTDSMSGKRIALATVMPPGTRGMCVSKANDKFCLEMSLPDNKSHGRGSLLDTWLSNSVAIYDAAIEKNSDRGNVLDVDSHSHPCGPMETLEYCIQHHHPCVARLATSLHEHWTFEFGNYVKAIKEPWFGNSHADYSQWMRDMFKRLERRSVLCEVTAALSIGERGIAARLLKKLR